MYQTQKISSVGHVKAEGNLLSYKKKTIVQSVSLVLFGVGSLSIRAGNSVIILLPRLEQGMQGQKKTERKEKKGTWSGGNEFIYACHDSSFRMFENRALQLLNTIKTNTKLVYFNTRAKLRYLLSCFVEYPLYLIACCLPHHTINSFFEHPRSSSQNV